jgi:hypothetical protein
MKDIILSRIEYNLFKELFPNKQYPGSILTPLKLSMVVAGFTLSNVKLDESKDVFLCKPTGRIIAIRSNYCNTNKCDWYKFEVKKVKVPGGRGRPPSAKTKKKEKRKTGTVGKHINTCMSFDILHSTVRKPKTDKLKVYKIAVFRTGVVGIPGGLRLDMSDMKEPLEEELCPYLEKFLKEQNRYTGPVKVIRRVFHNINTRCYIRNKETMRIRTKTLGKIVQSHMTNQNPIDIRSVNYTDAKRPNRLRIQFNRIKTWSKKQDDKVTVDIHLTSVVLEGSKDPNDTVEICAWINKIMVENYSKVIYNIKDPIIDSDSDSDSDSDITPQVMGHVRYDPKDTIGVVADVNCNKESLTGFMYE